MVAKLSIETCLNIISALRPLVAAAVENIRHNGKWGPELEQTEAFACSNYLYTSENQGPSSWSTQEGTEEDWGIARSRVVQELSLESKLAIFEAQLRDLGGVDYPARFGLESLITRMARAFHGGEPEDNSDAALAALLLHDLSGKPVEHSIVARAAGLVILSEPIELEIPGGLVVLEAFTREMFEKPRRVSRYIPEPFFPDFPTALISIRLVALAPVEAQKVLEKAKTIASLFDPCNLEINEYSMSSSGLRRHGGRMTSGRLAQARRQLVLRQEDVAEFRKFWKQMWPAFPFEPFATRNENPATVSLGRYTEACTEPRSAEYSMTTVMMGLESLFTEGAPEISYRLRQRLSNFLGHVGLDPHSVHATVREGYNIRSTLVHGGSISYKDRRRIDAMYGSLNELLRRNLDLLRLSILLMFLTRMEKDRVLDLLDESMFDSKKREELGNILAHHKTALGRIPVWN
ncbi:MAG: hypothetical protein WC876_06565 [Candidatus Thermoplasmatota archaeon]|jgi:hypothetical protein